MRIEPNETPTELTYAELLNGLITDINTDQSMPEADKDKARQALKKANDILAKYSA